MSYCKTFAQLFIRGSCFVVHGNAQKCTKECNSEARFLMCVCILVSKCFKIFQHVNAMHIICVCAHANRCILPGIICIKWSSRYVDLCLFTNEPPANQPQGVIYHQIKFVGLWICHSGVGFEPQLRAGKHADNVVGLELVKTEAVLWLELVSLWNLGWLDRGISRMIDDHDWIHQQLLGINFNLVWFVDDYQHLANSWVDKLTNC